jgi:hypothetical protein
LVHMGNLYNSIMHGCAARAGCLALKPWKERFASWCNKLADRQPLD